jgi:hypothetical protein
LFFLSASIAASEVLKKFPYFADTTERGDRGCERRPKDRVKDRVTFKDKSLASVTYTWKLAGAYRAMCKRPLLV